MFLRASFDVFRHSSLFLIFSLKTEFVLYVFGVFVDSIGGTPDKRIPEGFFLRFLTKFAFLFFSLKTEFVLYVFGVLVDSILQKTTKSLRRNSVLWVKI